MATTSTLASNWQSIKPRVIALVVGLVAGPFISNMLGWQVTSGNAQARTDLAVVAQQASFCEARARADVKEPSKLDYSGRRDLAQKWAVMPGQTAPDSSVINACADKLAI
jgi:hypothetical protein